MIIISVLIGLCFATLLYISNKKQHYSKLLNTILFIIRSLSISLIVILFFNPYIKVNNKVTEPSTIIIAQDNSNSLILNKDSVFYKKDYPLVLDTLINSLNKKHSIDKYLFGNEVKDFDTIDYQDYYTDIHEVLKIIKKDYYKKNVGAVILLSDGISNKSYSPEQDIESFPFPIYTVTLGDTTNYPDLYIKDVFYNKSVPTETTIPIRLVANANNCRNKTINVKLLVDNEIIEEVEIPVNTNRFSNTIDFSIDSGEEGAKQIDIQIEEIEDELTTKNNSKRLFINVVDKQYKVLFYAKSPHPDLGSIKNILADNFDIEIIFSNEQLPDLKEYDIIFLHQIPYLGMSNFEELNHALKENKDLPIFYIVGENTDIESFNKIQNLIEINRGAVNSNLDIKPYLNNTFGLFNIDNEIVNEINKFPPLSLPHLEFSYKNNHDILLQANINDISTSNPVLSFSSDERKNAFLFGTNIWKWKLYDYYNNKSYDNFEEIFTKSVKYLLTEKDKELIINHKESYLNNEPIIFTADLRNPSQELTNESDLRINISNKNTKKIYEYYFSKKDKSYYLNISTLPKGIYNFTAEARYGNIIYSEKGSFTVDDVGAEAQDLVANSQRMQLLSSLTGGKNFYVNELDKLTKAIDNDERITSIMREETDYKDLINMKSLFFVILSLISIEWILRKIFGTY
ncbi:MAG: hypothetical protein E7068_03595 [Lentimicrobiaceae bacterium]|nr:hypothetical protein [Lentimicrobiaceae bacterium]